MKTMMMVFKKHFGGMGEYERCRHEYSNVNIFFRISWNLPLRSNEFGESALQSIAHADQAVNPDHTQTVRAGETAASSSWTSTRCRCWIHTTTSPIPTGRRPPSTASIHPWSTPPADLGSGKATTLFFAAPTSTSAAS